MTHRERVQISPRPALTQICRKLHEAGQILRGKRDGKVQEWSADSCRCSTDQCYCCLRTGSRYQQRLVASLV